MTHHPYLTGRFDLALTLLLTSCLLLNAKSAFAAVSTNVPISAALANSIAADLFPATIKLDNGNLFLTNPVVQFLEDGRVGMRVRIQAYDHRPAEGIAVSEMGHATISGALGYDSGPKQILMSDPRIDTLEFDQSNAATLAFLRAINSAWSAQVTNPLRASIPPHPYVLPFRNNIQNLSYDGKNIILTISYE